MPSTGKGGFLEANATLKGAEVNIGHQLSKSTMLSGYAGRTWSGEKEAGVRFKIKW
jgi:hypothetical protein